MTTIKKPRQVFKQGLGKKKLVDEQLELNLRALMCYLLRFTNHA